MRIEAARRHRFRLGRRSKRHATAWVLALLLLGAPPPPAKADNSLAYDGFVGLGSAISSLVYSPLKVVYAVGGTAISAVALVWTFGDTDVAGSIFTQTVGGDYVVTPAHLQGDKTLEFFGRR